MLHHSKVQNKPVQRQTRLWNNKYTITNMILYNIVRKTISSIKKIEKLTINVKNHSQLTEFSRTIPVKRKTKQ